MRAKGVFTLTMCLFLAGLLLASPALADDNPGPPPPKSPNLDYGPGEPPPGAVPPPEQRGTHGCLVICNYPNGPCAWARCNGYDSTSAACSRASSVARSVCYQQGKTPVTGCFIYKSW